MSYFDSSSLKIVADQRQQELRAEAESARRAKALRGGRQPWWRRLFGPRPTAIGTQVGLAPTNVNAAPPAPTMVARAF